MLIFSIPLEHYDKFFKNYANYVQVESVTGLLLIYPQHFVHIVEVRIYHKLCLCVYQFSILSHYSIKLFCLKCENFSQNLNQATLFFMNNVLASQKFEKSVSIYHRPIYHVTDMGLHITTFH